VAVGAMNSSTEIHDDFDGCRLSCCADTRNTVLRGAKDEIRLRRAGEARTPKLGQGTEKEAEVLDGKETKD
jgi:hypothetical protein